ncbi:efflux RND transporter periplasmic adaptor subunit [bacterium]|nr:efflux RND transporter periplasmic adaptor subunit [bacterium]
MTRTIPTIRVAVALAALAVVAPVMTGCGGGEPEPTEHLRPVRWQRITGTDGGRTRVFAGVTRAGQEIVLSFKVGGTIERLPVTVGTRVAAGDLIATLDDSDYRLQTDEAEASLRRAEAELRNAQATYERVEALYEADNASLSELEASRAGFETAEAGVRAARNGLELARRQLDYTSLEAPTDGAIAARPVEVGENVQAGQQVALLTAGERAEVEVSLPGQLVTDLEVGDPATVTINALEGRTFAARVTEIGVAATGGGSTFPVTVRLDGSDPAVLSGMSAEVALTFGTEDGRRVYLVPASAIGEDDDGRYAFVVRFLEDGKGTASRIPVRTGDLTNQGLEVIDGLQAGDMLITAGVHRIRDGQTVLVPQS